jgi:hypothetical protein
MTMDMTADGYFQYPIQIRSVSIPVHNLCPTQDKSVLYTLPMVKTTYIAIVNVKCYK